MTETSHESVSDELLMAFADGELRGSERDDVQAYVGANPEAARRVAEFVASRDGLARLLNQALIDPVPARLLETVMGDARPPDGSGRNRVAQPASLWRTLSSSLPGLFGNWPLTATAALTASVLAGIAIGHHWTDVSAPALVAIDNGDLVASGPLAALLETAPSGKLVALASGAATLKPILSFERATGGFCRQYALQQGQGSRSSAVSCRTSDGRWTIEAIAPVSPEGLPGQVHVSGSETALRVDDAVTRLMKGDALGADRERDLIARKWSQDKP